MRPRKLPKTTKNPDLKTKKDVGRVLKIIFLGPDPFYIYEKGPFNHYLFLRFHILKKMTRPIISVSRPKINKLRELCFRQLLKLKKSKYLYFF